MNVIETLAELHNKIDCLARKLNELHELSSTTAAASAAAQTAAEASVRGAEQYRTKIERALAEAKLDLREMTKSVDRALQEMAALSSELTEIELPKESFPKPKIRAFILVAEDLEVNQELVRSILETAGHQVDIVTNGIEAVAAVLAKSYDLVLMDIQMPRMDGITATREIRALNHPTCKVPIIAVTSNVLPEQVRSFKEAGMNDHIGKPANRIDLINKINKWAVGLHPVRSTAD